MTCFCCSRFLLLLFVEMTPQLFPALQLSFNPFAHFDTCTPCTPCPGQKMPFLASLRRSELKKQTEYRATIDRRLFRDLGQAFPELGANKREAFEKNSQYFKRELYRADCSIAWISDGIIPCNIKVRPSTRAKRRLYLTNAHNWPGLFRRSTQSGITGCKR